MNRRTFGKALVASLLGAPLISESKPKNRFKYMGALSSRMAERKHCDHCEKTATLFIVNKPASVGTTDYIHPLERYCENCYAEKELVKFKMRYSPWVAGCDTGKTITFSGAQQVGKSEPKAYYSNVRGYWAPGDYKQAEARIKRL